MSQEFGDLQDYLTERPNLSKLPVDKGYRNRYPVGDDEIEWDHPSTPYYEEVRDRYYSKLNPRIQADFEAGRYGTHPEIITDELTAEFKEQGLDIDAKGRPRNPGGKTGLGNRWGLWHFGGRDVADMVVTRETKANGLEVLVIRKAGKDKAALPGGFVNNGEDFVEAAVREVEEETGTRIAKADASLLVERLLTRSSRTTDHAWLYSNIAHAHLTDQEANQLVEVQDTEEGIEGAMWQKVSYDLLVPMSEHHRSPIVSVAKQLGYIAAVGSRE